MAEKRIKRLLERAVQADDMGKARRYLELAQKIGERNQVRLGKFKHLFCEKCGAPPSRLKIRLREGKKVARCQECGHVQKKPYKNHYKRGTKA